LASHETTGAPGRSSTPVDGSTTPRPRGLVVPLSVAAWLIALVAGFGVLRRYDATAAAATDAPPAQWPPESSIARVPGRPTLLAFLHPKCPCSRATLAELERSMARRGDLADVRFLVLTPREEPPEWSRTDVRARADAFPGAVVLDDVDGVEAARFRATTSGAVLLYDADGVLRFDGGITISRGHEGGSPGAEALVDVLTGAARGPVHFPVFGCALASPEAGPRPSPASTKHDDADVSRGVAR
jgi:hypothetical protein